MSAYDRFQNVVRTPKYPPHIAARLANKWDSPKGSFRLEIWDTPEIWVVSNKVKGLHRRFPYPPPDFIPDIAESQKYMIEAIQTSNTEQFVFYVWRDTTQTNKAYLYRDQGKLDFRPMLDFTRFSIQVRDKYKVDFYFNYIEFARWDRYRDVLTVRYVDTQTRPPEERETWQARFYCKALRFLKFYRVS